MAGNPGETERRTWKPQTHVASSASLLISVGGGQGSGLSWVVSNPSLGAQWGLAAEAVFTVAVVWTLLAWKLTDHSVSALADAADPSSSICLLLRMFTLGLAADSPSLHEGWGVVSALNSVTPQASSLDQMEAPSPNLFLGAAQEIRFCLSPCRIMPCYWVHLGCGHSQVGASQSARWAPPRAPKRKPFPHLLNKPAHFGWNQGKGDLNHLWQPSTYGVEGGEVGAPLSFPSLLPWVKLYDQVDFCFCFVLFNLF